jgi:hypothetical protein
MRTRKCHLAHVSTAAAVSAAKSGSWTATAVSLGFDAKMGPTLSDVARGKPSAVTQEGEDLIRAALGLPVILTASVPICPVHNVPHVAECHGHAVAAVVTLAPGERVAAPRRPATPRTLSDYPPAVLAQMIRQRETYQP